MTTSLQLVSSVDTPGLAYCPHRPTPKQRAFLALSEAEVLFGGAAGPGKSAALLMAALQYVHLPDYAALLLRRTYADLSLPGALMSRAQEWLAPTDAKWSEVTKTWTFPSGATLTFGYLEHENARYRYQSTEFSLIGFDELTQFSETQYRYMFSRLRRREGSQIPLRMRSASNPGGTGHDWVKLRFLDTYEPDRVFLPARLADNPHVDQEAYIQSLSHLDPVTVQQLLAGDWSARQSGDLFRRESFPVVDAVPDGCRWVRYWDLAATAAAPGKSPDYTAGALVGLLDGVWYIADMRRLQGPPASVEALVWQTAQLDGKRVAVRMEQEPGSSGVNTIDHYRRRVLVGYDFRGVRSTGSKIERSRPVSSAAHAGNIRLVLGDWVHAFLDEIEAFPNGSHDDQVDAVSGAVSVLPSPWRVPSSHDTMATSRRSNPLLETF